MRDYSSLEQKLKSIFDASSFRIVKGSLQHYQKTPNCPSISELTTRHLTREQRLHTQDCVYCKKVLRAARQTWLDRTRDSLVRTFESFQDVRLPAKLTYVAALGILLVLTVELTSLRKTAANSAQDLAVLRQEVPPAMQDIGQTLKNLDEHARSAAAVQQSERNEIDALLANRKAATRRIRRVPSAAPGVAASCSEVHRIDAMLRENQRENQELLTELRELVNQLSEYQDASPIVGQLPSDELPGVADQLRERLTPTAKPRVPTLFVRFVRIPRRKDEGSWIVRPPAESDGISASIAPPETPRTVFHLAVVPLPDNTNNFRVLTDPLRDFDSSTPRPARFLTNSDTARPGASTACSRRFK